MLVLRLIALFLLLWIAWRLVRRWVLPALATRMPGQFERMARCDRCGTHVPQRELSGGRCARCR